MAAGLGFKTFTTGEVLTAADTNGYLMQGVLVFANAAARDAAITSPQEGQCCYLKDTDAVLTYSGAAWVGFDDSNAIQNTIVDAKGDIVAASGSDTPARLAVGNNGETLVADSSQTTGLAYREDYAAGKNKIINGDFTINQRAFTSSTVSGTYGPDRFRSSNSDGTVTYSVEAFTPGAAPVAGYEAANFARMVTTGQTATSARARIQQSIENVRTFAGQTITISLWAKAASGTPQIAIGLNQNFGSGGSPSTAVDTFAGKITLTTSWARYSVTIAVPSISGKTIGTTANTSYLLLYLWVSAGSDFNSITSSLGIQTNTFDIWGVQAEDGSVATAFNTATGTLQGELAACQRYYFRMGGDQAYQSFGIGRVSSSTAGGIFVNLPVTMRVGATAIDYSTLLAYDGSASSAVTSLSINQTSKNFVDLLFGVASGLTAQRVAQIQANNSTSAYLGFTAEL